MADVTPDFVTWDELCSWDAPTHMMKEWGGAVDPCRPTDNPTIQQNIADRLVHEEEFHFLGMIRTAKQFVDIGANCGQSIVSYRALNPDTPIVSFEPNPICFRVLCANGGQLPGVRAYPFGLSDSNGFMELYTPVIDRLLMTPYATTDRELYRTGRGAEWLTENDHGRRTAIYPERLAFQQGDSFDLTPSILKIDVEGAELRVLHGMVRTILQHRPIIMTENSRMGEVVRFLRMLDYSAWQWIDDQLSEIDLNDIIRWGKVPVNILYLHEPDVNRHAQENDFNLRRIPQV